MLSLFSGIILCSACQDNLMLHTVSNAKHKIAEEDVDEEANSDFAKKVLPQILDEDKDNEREKDEEAGDENCSWVKNSRELLSRQTRPV